MDDGVQEGVSNTAEQCNIESTAHSEKAVDEELERLAVEALLQEAKRGKVRADQAGPSAWKKCELPKTNKRFLGNVVLGAMASNKKMRLEPESRKKSHTLPSSMTQKRLDKEHRHQRGSALLSGKTHPRPDDEGTEQRGHSIASRQRLKEESFQTSRKHLSKQPNN